MRPCAVHHEDEGVRRLEHERYEIALTAEAFLGLAQRLLGPPALGDVHQDAGVVAHAPPGSRTTARTTRAQTTPPSLRR